MINFGAQRWTAPDTYAPAAANDAKWNLKGLGSVVGAHLGKRDRDIEYLREMGVPEDRLTTAEGIAAAWEWVKGKTGQAGQALAPIVDEFKSSGAALLKPLGDALSPKLDDLNNEIVDFQDPWKRHDEREAKKTEAYEKGKAVWEVPMGGLPAPETLGAPPEGAPTPEPLLAPLTAEAPAVGGLPVPAGMAPAQDPKVIPFPTAPKETNWSKLYQIDPERAKFEWQQEYQQGVLDKPRGSSSITGNKAADMQQEKDDRAIQEQIAAKSTELFKNMREKGWSTGSPEYIDAYGKILALNAQKWKPSSTTDLDRYIKLYSSEKTAKRDDEKLALQVKQDLDKNERLAFEDATKGVGDVMGKVKDVGAQLSKVNELMQDAAQGNVKSLQAASKILIQSLDNSAVMAGEIDMFSDQSLIGQLRGLASRVASGTKYSKQDMQDLWNVGQSIASGVNGWVDTKGTQAQDIYKARGGSDASPGIAQLMGLYRAPDFAGMPAFPDFLEEKLQDNGTADTDKKYDAMSGPKKVEKVDQATDEDLLGGD